MAKWFSMLKLAFVSGPYRNPNDANMWKRKREREKAVINRHSKCCMMWECVCVFASVWSCGDSDFRSSLVHSEATSHSDVVHFESSLLNIIFNNNRMSYHSVFSNWIFKSKTRISSTDRQTRSKQNVNMPDKMERRVRCQTNNSDDVRSACAASTPFFPSSHSHRSFFSHLTASQEQSRLATKAWFFSVFFYNTSFAFLLVWTSPALISFGCASSFKMCFDDLLIVWRRFSLLLSVVLIRRKQFSSKLKALILKCVDS